MLALLERLVTDAGGTYAFCDTDWMAIVATPDGGQVPCQTAADGETIRALAGGRSTRSSTASSTLNPYDPTPLPNRGRSSTTASTEQLYCYAISAKRYALYRPARRHARDLVAARYRRRARRRGEPMRTARRTGQNTASASTWTPPPKLEKPARDDEGRRLWIRDAWQWILDDAHGQPAPARMGNPLRAHPLHGLKPRLANWFTGYNRTSPASSSPPRQLRPDRPPNSRLLHRAETNLHLREQARTVGAAPVV